MGESIHSITTEDLPGQWPPGIAERAVGDIGEVVFHAILDGLPLTRADVIDAVVWMQNNLYDRLDLPDALAEAYPDTTKQ